MATINCHFYFDYEVIRWIFIARSIKAFYRKKKRSKK